jgi:hypothetical protein
MTVEERFTKLEEFETRYDEEFEKHGVERLTIKGGEDGRDHHCGRDKSKSTLSTLYYFGLRVPRAKIRLKNFSVLDTVGRSPMAQSTMAFGKESYV